MKKEDLKIEIGNLYELSERRNPHRDMYVKKPKTRDDYFLGESQVFLSLPNFGAPGFYMEKENNLVNTNPTKYIVMAKNVIWFNFCNKTTPKAAYDIAWLPIVEVYDLKNNKTFFVKPKILIECRDGKDLNEIAQNNLNNLKQKLLTTLRAK